MDIPHAVLSLSTPQGQLRDIVKPVSPLVRPIEHIESFTYIWRRRQVESRDYHHNEELFDMATTILEFVQGAEDGDIVMYLWRIDDPDDSWFVNALYDTRNDKAFLFPSSRWRNNPDANEHHERSAE